MNQGPLRSVRVLSAYQGAQTHTFFVLILILFTEQFQMLFKAQAGSL